MSEKMLGILGGMGPLATAYFTKLIVEMTDADKDQKHIPMMIFNDTSIPDRTEFILDDTKDNPVPKLVSDAKILESTGVCNIAIPCNTAHYFYQEIQKAVNIPVINIVEETVKYISEHYSEGTRVGILATKGTIASKVYQNFCDKYGLSYIVPSAKLKEVLMSVIYDQVKMGKSVSEKDFTSIISIMKNSGADVVILGCTELSVIKNDLKLKSSSIVDSMEVLSKTCIESVGKKVVNGYFAK